MLFYIDQIEDKVKTKQEQKYSKAATHTKEEISKGEPKSYSLVTTKEP